MKKFFSNIRHKNNVWLWEREVKRETWRRVKPFGVKKGSYEYKIVLEQVANEDHW